MQLGIEILESLIREMKIEQEIYSKKKEEELRIYHEKNSYNSDGSKKSADEQFRDSISGGYQQTIANSFIELLSPTEAKLYYRAKKYGLISIDDQMLLESQRLQDEMFRVKNQWISTLTVQNKITQAKLEVDAEEEGSDKEILLYQSFKFFRRSFLCIKKIFVTPFEYYLKLSPAVQIAVLFLVLSVFGINTLAQPILDHLSKP